MFGTKNPKSMHRQVWAKDQVDCSARPFGVEAAEVWSWVLSRPLVGWLVGWSVGRLFSPFGVKREPG